MHYSPSTTLLMRMVWIFCFLLATATTQAQDSARLQVVLRPRSPELAQARGFDKARRNVQLSCRSFFGGAPRPLKAFNDSTWQLKVPKGGYFVELQAFGFDSSRHYIDVQGDTSLQVALRSDSLAYCYENGQPFHYIPGSIAFEQNIWLRFKSGSPAENQAWLQAQLPLRHIEMLAPNVFYLTLRLKAEKSLAQLLYEEQYGAVELGCYLGEAIREAIEKAQQTGRLDYANCRWHWASP